MENAILDEKPKVRKTVEPPKIRIIPEEPEKPRKKRTSNSGIAILDVE